tara:strand:- start:14847 stop:17396 length:2550 start_codon:yes stop_codon:yes gene_type:complete
MKVKFSLIALLLFSLSTIAQVTNDGNPLSWDLNLNTDGVAQKSLPEFDMNQVKAEDLINDQKTGIPWRFGYTHSVDYGFEDGTWTELDNGDRIWRLLVTSPGAISLNFIFDDFFIPNGAKLYLYSDDRDDLLGAYTSIQNQDSGILGTWLVYDDKVWLEYYEPAIVTNQGRLHIAKVTHGYRNASDHNSKGLNDSGDCNLDVNCSIGDDWQDLKDHNKKSVALIIMGGSTCTGALINNTENDGTPYFLTANHCYGGNEAAWAFRFGWISPTNVCATTVNSQNGPTNMTMSGATLRSRSSSSDFALLEINSSIPASWDRVFAGWDRSESTPDFSVGIHHPSGDVMKVCRDNSPALSTFYSGAAVWEINDATGGWEIGVTEGGSSGSPLFDQNGKIIGQLYAGTAACSGTVDNNGWDVYGRLGISWTGNGSSTTRLSDWLDPNGTNPTYIESYPAFETLAVDGGITSIDSPVTGNLSDNENITITLRNFGENEITNFDISFQVNDGNIITENYSGSISSTQIVQYTSDAGFDLSLEGDYEISVFISITNDENADNDSLTSVVTNIGGGDCPDQYSLPIVWRDNFECYDPFAIDNIGNWISYDNDGGTTWGANDLDFTNESYVGSAIIFNYPLSVSAGGDISTWNTYEGNQGLYFFASGANSTTFPNDDWMISPEFTLDGITSPQLTFWAKSVTDQYGLERFRVAVGNTTDYNDFTVISSGNYTEAPTSWTQYQFDLSAYEGQTIRLAIHYVANDSFALQMDSFVVEGTLGVEDIDFNDVEYFYNSVSKELEIMSSQILEVIEVYNLLGQNIISEEINSRTAKIDLSSLDTSIYLIKAIGESAAKSFKLHIY